MPTKPLTMTLEQTLELIKQFYNPHSKFKSNRVKVEGDLVYLDSLRLVTFALQGTTCVGCGLKAKHFLKFKRVNDNSYHLNLYGYNKKHKRILFTKDHIKPRSKGGTDTLDNMQVMCCDCNRKKGDTYVETECA